jgi:uncharacterized protein
MIIDLRQLDVPSGRIEGVQEVAVAPHSQEAVNVSFRVTLDYSHSGGAVHFRGRVEGTLETACDRCLEAIRKPVAGDFDLVVRRSSEREPTQDVEDAEDYVRIPLGEHEVSLEPFVRETAVVSVPMVILCAENCRGLCAVCGTNRNREECRCQPVVDTRWNALRRLSDGGDRS